jgi:hypothetical protein
MSHTTSYVPIVIAMGHLQPGCMHVAGWIVDSLLFHSLSCNGPRLLLTVARDPKLVVAPPAGLAPMGSGPVPISWRGRDREYLEPGWWVRGGLHSTASGGRSM